MKLLAFDTSASACSVALLNEAETTHAHIVAPMQQTKLILPTIDKLLSDSSLTLSQLDAIAYASGPGSFTGIRIAASVAQGLSYACDLPVIAVSSMAVLAQTAFLEKEWRKLLIAIDARTKQVYWSCYEINAQKLAVLSTPEEVCSPNDITPPMDQSEWIAIGDGWQPYSETLIERLGFTPKIINTMQNSSAKALLPLACAKFNQKEWLNASEVFPTYLR